MFKLNDIVDIHITKLDYGYIIININNIDGSLIYTLNKLSDYKKKTIDNSYKIRSYNLLEHDIQYNVKYVRGLKIKKILDV